ncbi:MAG: SDR family oxidoreductase [Parvularculaceae bacterium]|nr:SDR family oxidoreductase [Parvularculaceae bacterium]
MDLNGKWALVTGASAGIGEAFAEALAARGANVILTARRVDRLAMLAERLRAAHGVESLVVAADLSRAEAPIEIAAAVAAAGKPVDILVNNAGYGQPGHFQDVEWPVHRDFIELMMSSYAHLVRLFLPPMQQRGYGRIVNVASVAGLIPGSAGHTLYGAVKAFLISFSQSLAAENAGKGVNVSALCPGFTNSEFHDVNNTRALITALPRYMFMEAKPVVEGALDAVERGHVVYVPGMWNKFVITLIRFLPRPWGAALVHRQSQKFRRREEG